MKNWSAFVSLLTILLLNSCGLISGDDDIIIPAPNQLPEIAQNFISDSYSGYTIRSIEFEDLCSDSIYYEVELEDGPGPDVDLYFTLSGDFLFAAYDIQVADLPQAVLAVISQDFSGYSIDQDDIERYEFPDGSLQYALDLDANNSGSDLEVVFFPDGSIYCQENDGNNNGGGGGGGDSTSVNLPTDVQAFIDANYGGYRVDSYETEDYCDDLPAWEVELEDGPGPDIDLYFSTSWVFLFAETEISVNSIPNAVLTAIANNYPGYEIDDDKVWRWDWADGSQSYSMELESDDDDVELVFNADGSIYCMD